MIGQTLGHYRMEGQLSAGSKLERQVAVEFLPEDLSRDRRGGVGRPLQRHYFDLTPSSPNTVHLTTRMRLAKSIRFVG